MASVELARTAVEDLDALITTHSLPANARARTIRSLQPLKEFPRLGPELIGRRWEELRFVLGPWRWMIIVYAYFEEDDRVVVVTVQDGRARTAAAGRAR